VEFDLIVVREAVEAIELAVEVGGIQSGHGHLLEFQYRVDVHYCGAKIFWKIGVHTRLACNKETIQQMSIFSPANFCHILHNKNIAHLRANEFHSKINRN
jgi:hypothetical protein